MTTRERKKEGEAAAERVAIPGLIPGRTVHYVMDVPLSAGESPPVRPAVVVTVADHFTGESGLRVFVDGDRDGYPPEQAAVWKGGARYSKGREPGTWHWPPRH
jgi:hypothetical protein